jgi:hypothetical protein
MAHYDQTTAPFRPRGYPGVLRFFDGFDLIEPGLVRIHRWRPGNPEDIARAGVIAAYGAVGRRR